MDNTQFFYRTAIFTRKDNQVALADIYQPETSSPLDDWMGIVVSLADGKHTIQELVGYLSNRYQQAPANLEETLHSVIERLLEGKIIQLSEDAVELPYYLASPIEELDIEKAISLIQEDGYSTH
ncbi:MAG: hypothetical protein V7718_03630 [Porticoccus sp.]